MGLLREICNRNYVPVVFDFENPRRGTTINTVTLLARMARFVIAEGKMSLVADGQFG